MPRRKRTPAICRARRSPSARWRSGTRAIRTCCGCSRRRWGSSCSSRASIWPDFCWRSSRRATESWPSGPRWEPARAALRGNYSPDNARRLVGRRAWRRRRLGWNCRHSREHTRRYRRFDAGVGAVHARRSHTRRRPWHRYRHRSADRPLAGRALREADLAKELHATSRSITDRAAGRRLLVGTQVAFGVVLLAAAGSSPVASSMSTRRRPASRPITCSPSEFRAHRTGLELSRTQRVRTDSRRPSRLYRACRAPASRSRFPSATP